MLDGRQDDLPIGKHHIRFLGDSSGKTITTTTTTTKPRLPMQEI